MMAVSEQIIWFACSVSLLLVKKLSQGLKQRREIYNLNSYVQSRALKSAINFFVFC